MKNFFSVWSILFTCLCILQIGRGDGIHFVYLCPTLVTLRTRIFGKVLASAILRFAFQSCRFETILWYNSLQYVRRLFNLRLFYQSSFYFYSIFFCLIIPLFSFRLEKEHIRPKQRPACSSSVPIKSGFKLLNPSIQPCNSVNLIQFEFWAASCLYSMRAVLILVYFSLFN
jgi:hypothetical protein